MQVRAYFVSDPGGHYLPEEYTSMADAQIAADGFNEDREADGTDLDLRGRYVVGAHLADGNSTFEIG